MSGHMVWVAGGGNDVTLRCHTCGWTMRMGYDTRPVEDAERVQWQPLVTLIRWAHADPSLLANDAAGESVERSMWRRVRQMLGGRP